MGKLDIQPVAEDARTRVFLSYSRKDAALVQRVAEGLMAAGFLADFDQAAHDPGNVSAGISAEDEWWKRLQEMIAAADAMVFLVSPDSAASAVCDEEIAYARALGKRIIAVLARPVDFAKAPPRLSALNVRIDFSEDGPGFDAALAGLVAALETNVGWHRDGRKYLIRVQEWDAEGRPKSQLLRDGAVEEAERWAVARPRNEPEPGALFLAWISASREQIKADAARRAFWRRVTGVFVLTTFLATVAGAWFVVNGQRNLGRSESLMLARTADQFFNEGDYLRALHLAILASRESFLSPTTDEAKAAFAKSAQALSHEASVRLPLSAGVFMQGAGFSPDSRQLAAWDSAGAIYVWNTGASEPVRVLQHGLDDPVYLAWFEPESDRLVSWSAMGVRLWRASDGAAVGKFLGEPDAEGRYAIRSVAPMPGHGQLVAVGLDGQPRILSLEDGRTVRTLETRVTGVQSVRTSDEAGLLYVVGEDAVETLDAATFERIEPPLAFDGPIDGLNLSPDGFQFAVWDKNGRVWLRDIVDRTTIELSGCHTTGQAGERPAGEITRVEFVAETARLVTVAENLTACVWKARTGERVGSPLPVDTATGASFDVSSDGRLLATTSFLSGSKITSLITGELVDELPEGITVSQVKFAPGSWQLLVMSGSAAYITSEGSLSLDGEPISERDVQFAEFTSDGSFVMALALDSTMRLIPASRPEMAGPPLPHTHFFFGPFESPDGKHVLTLDGNDLRLWRMDRYWIDTPDLGRAILSPDGSRLYRDDESGLGELVDTLTGKKVGDEVLSGGGLIVFDADEPQMALAFENTVQFIDTNTGVARDGLIESQHEKIDWGAFALDGRRFVSADESHRVAIWDTQTLKALGGLLDHAEAREQTFDSDMGIPPMSSASKRMVVWSGVSARLIDLETGQSVGKDMLHEKPKQGEESPGYVTGAAFSADGGHLATWNSIEVRLWNAYDGSPIGAPIRPSDGVAGAALSADGAALATFTGARAELWDVSSQQPRGVTVKPAGEIEGAAFSSNGRLLFTWGEGPLTIEGNLWKAFTGEAIGAPIPFTVQPEAPTFLENDRRIWWRDPIGGHLIIDTATGEVMARQHIGEYHTDAVLMAGTRQIQTVQVDRPSALWDVRFALSTDAEAPDVAAVCAGKLKGSPDTNGVPIARRLDSKGVFAAPILRGREGEDVCTPPDVPWWETAAGALFGWAFR